MALTMLVAAATALSGCAGTPGTAAKLPQVDSAVGSTAPTGPDSAAVADGCRVAPPIRLTADLKRAWATPWPESVALFDGSSADGGPAVAAVRNGRSAGVALVDPSTGRVERLLESYGSASQALGAYNGEYAVWEESHVGGSFGDYTVKEWSSRTGAVTRVGHSHEDAHGESIPGSDELPIVAGDYAAWIETVKDDGQSNLVLLDLRSGTRSVIRRGHIGWTALTPTTIVWTESLHPGATTVVRAASVATGKATAPPVGLAHARGAWAIATDGTAWAWTEGVHPSLYAASSDKAEAVDIGRVPGGASPVISISQDIVTVPISAGGMMIADLTSKAWTDERHAAYPVLDGEHFLIPELATGNSTATGTAVATLARHDVAALRCPR